VTKSTISTAICTLCKRMIFDSSPSKLSDPQALCFKSQWLRRIITLIFLMVSISLVGNFNTPKIALSTSIDGNSSTEKNINNAPEKPMRKNAITFNSSSYRHNQSAECSRDVSPILFDEWRQSKEIICTSHEVSIEQLRLDRWEYKPTITVYKNIILNNLFDDVNKTDTSCEVFASNTLNDASNITAINHPVIRVQNFGTFNAYERFHSYLNIAMVMATLNITNPQLVYMVMESEMKSIPRSISNVVEMWASFSSLKPIIAEVPSSRRLTGNGGAVLNTDQPMIALPYMVDFPFQGTSIMVTKTVGGALRGRGIDHHCKSEIFRGITDYIRTNLGIGDESNDADFNNTIQVLWSSRGPFCCHPKDGTVYTPSRSIYNEQKLVQAVQTSLGSHYNITTVDFGANMTTIDSVKAAYKAQILVGVHGAGLVWSAFMKQHSGLVEIFGGDRGSSNRHYHNIASLADIHYRSLTLGGGEGKSLIWDEKSVDQIVKKIRSINMDEEPSANEP